MASPNSERKDHSVFVCECDPEMRSACTEEPFYKEKGKRYCILHFPGEEKAEQFSAAIKRKLTDKDFNFRGVWFPSGEIFPSFNFSTPAYFSGATFSAGADFRETTFGAGADFTKATFTRTGATFGGKWADFTEATFSAGADFTRATFSAGADFSRATFSAEADFTKATFSESALFSGATFSANVDFRATFSADVYFRATTFGAGAYFSEGTTFSAEADFCFATFAAEAEFSEATFTARADFSIATFSADANFRGATFTRADFRVATFSERALFKEATFNEEANFGGATFSAKADFSEATFSAKADFGQATFGDYVRFSGIGAGGFLYHSTFDLQFATIKTSERVSFHSLTLRPCWFVNVDARKFEFSNVEWAKDSLSKGIDELARNSVSTPHRLLSIAYRRLAVNAEENHRYEEASTFRYLSMDARRREEWRGLAFWRLSWLYWVASGYGEHFKQAAAVLGFIILLFAFSYTQVGFERTQTKEPSSLQSAPLDTVGVPLSKGKAFIYSLQVMTFQKPDPRPLTPAAQLLVTFELILGPVQAALFVLAVRRKFIR